MVELVRSGRAIRELAREFECSDQTIRNWVRQTDLDEGRRDDGLTSEEREGLPRGSSPRATASSDGRRSCARRISHLWSTTRGSSSCPGSRSPNLGSHILAIVRRRLPQDWTERYNTNPALIETFVETPRYTGAVYRASCWIRVGTTQGRGRYDRHRHYDKPKKDIWLRPLRRKTGNKSSIAETTAITPRENVYCARRSPGEEDAMT